MMFLSCFRRLRRALNASGLAPSACAAGALFASLLPATPAQARFITVTQTGERSGGNSGCTLREAIQAVNNQTSVMQCGTPDGGTDTIYLPGSPTAYTVRLDISTDTLTIRRGVTITGDGYQKSVITRASGGANLFEVQSTNNKWVNFQGIQIRDISNSHALVVQLGGWVQLNHVHIKRSGRGNANTYGCVRNAGSLFMSSVEISECNGWEAGAVYNNGLLSVDKSAILGTTYAARGGGAIRNISPSASAVITSSTLAQNRSSVKGSALSNELGAKAELNQVTVVYNFIDPAKAAAGNSVSALYNDGTGTLTVKGSLISSNTNYIANDPAVRPNPNCSSNVTSKGYNFLGDPNAVHVDLGGSTPCAPIAKQATDVSSGTLSLEKNGDNSPKAIGGATRGYLPRDVAGNPVLRLVDQTACSSSDQRGLTHRDSSPCEAGSVSRGHATMVVGNPTTLSSADTVMKTWLEELGFFVFAIDDGAAAIDFNNPGLTVGLISSSVSDGTLGSKYRSARAGMVVNKVEQLDDMRMVESLNYGLSSSTSLIYLGNDPLRLGAAIGDLTNMSLSTGGSTWANVALYDWAALYTTLGGYPIVYFPKGTTGASAFSMPAGRISFPGTAGFFNSGATAAGKRMFQEVVLWVSRQRP